VIVKMNLVGLDFVTICQRRRIPHDASGFDASLFGFSGREALITQITSPSRVARAGQAAGRASGHHLPGEPSGKGTPVRTGATGEACPVRSRASGAWLACHAARLDDRSVGEQRAGVVEDHHAVAEQAPALFGMAGDHARSLAVRRVRRWARR
jgi:hypothetical protein